MDRKMIEGVRAALDTMAELELAQQAKRNAEAKEAAERLAAVKEHHEKDAEGNVIPHDDEDAVKEGKFKDMVIKKQDKAMGAKPVPTKKKYPDHLTLKKARAAFAPTKGGADVKKKEAKMDPVGKADADIDNDGDVDSSDEYLHKRRKAIGKTMKKEDTDIRGKLMSIWEDAAGAKRKAGATPPENVDGGKDGKSPRKDMRDAHSIEKHGKGEKEDPESKKAEDSTKPSAMRNNDNKQGDKAVMKSATPDHPAHKTTKEQVEEIKAAYESMYKKEDENGS